MIVITGKRKIKLDKRLSKLSKGRKFQLGVKIDESMKNVLLKIGFSPDLEPGESVLPAASIGPVCRYNAEGKEIVHKDRPMETAYRQVEWTWEQWAGYYGTETQSKIVDVPYKRYPRTPVLPPSIELTLVEGVIAAKLQRSATSPKRLL